MTTTISTSPTPAEIAAGLSEAQREALLALNDAWQAGPELPVHVTDHLLPLREAGLVKRHFADVADPDVRPAADGLSIHVCACWFFSLTPLGTFGNSGRNIIEIPGLNNWDLSVVKKTGLGERLETQLRFEFFNIFNHAQFNQPDLTVGDALFGAIRSARDGRISQVALKLLW